MSSFRPGLEKRAPHRGTVRAYGEIEVDRLLTAAARFARARGVGVIGEIAIPRCDVSLFPCRVPIAWLVLANFLAQPRQTLARLLRPAAARTRVQIFL